MARPRKTAAEKLSRRLPSPRCTAQELATIQAKAAQAGLTPTEYLRRAALDGTIIVRQARTDFATADQLRRIGVNLNQLMPALHKTGQMTDDLRRMAAKLETALDLILDDYADRR